MQNNEYRLYITTSDEHTNRDSLNQNNLQTEYMEHKILPMVNRESEGEQTISSGYPSYSLPNNQDIELIDTEGMIGITTDTRTIKQSAEEMLDDVTFSDEEMDIPNNNLTNEAYNNEMKKVTELYEETDATLNKYTGTKHEAEETREIPEVFEIEAGQTMNDCGFVDDVVEDKVIVKVNLYNGILDLDNILFTANKIPFGYIDDVIGKVEEPYYVIKFFPNFSDKSIVCKGHSIYYINQKAKTIQTRQLSRKGCDASNAFDEEVSEDEVEFSDDDQEVERKKQKVNFILNLRSIRRRG
jgi:rRNA processing protein Gar1